MSLRFIVIFAILLLVCSVSGFGQNPNTSKTPEIYEGCGSGELYDPLRDRKGRIVYRYNRKTKQNEPVKTNIRPSSESRFVYTFRPNRTTVNKGDKIVFTPFPFGRDTQSYDPSGKSPIERLREERYSTRKFEENNGRLNWDETALGEVKAAGDWYVIYYAAEESASNLPNNAERYLLPFRQIVEGENIDARTISPDPYSPVRTTDTGIVIKSTVKKLSGGNILEFDTTGLTPGTYWFTLQNTAVSFGNQTGTCPKTTPSVLIKIVDPLHVRLDPPSIGPVSFQNPPAYKLPDSYSVKAYISGGTAPFRLRWRSEPNGVNLSDCPTSSTQREVTCTFRTGPGTNLTEGGRYNIQVEVTDKGEQRADCGNDCSKLIINNVPKVEKINIVSYSPLLIEAIVRDKDNEAGSDVTPQSLTLRWKITDEENREYTTVVSPVNNPTDNTYTERVTLQSAPTKGKFRVEVVVSDALDESSGDEGDVIPEGTGAGIVYFQFDEPYGARKYNFGDAEDWVKYYGRTGQCSEGGNPNKEFIDFYNQSGRKIPQMVETNSKKLRDIASILNGNQAYRLLLLGYADFRASRKYNYDLAERRLNAVVNYLERSVPNIRQRIERRINSSDDKAQSCRLGNCINERRHDRRVELIYFIGNVPDSPEYAPSKCADPVRRSVNKRNRSRKGK